MFDQKTIDYGRVEVTGNTVYVYTSYYERQVLPHACGTVLAAWWQGRCVQVRMDNGYTYIYSGFGYYDQYWPTNG